MNIAKRFSLAILTVFAITQAPAAELPEETATIFVHGFNVQGTLLTGPVGEDFNLPYAMQFATHAGLPTPFTNPNAPNQVAVTTYYGDQYPSYYTPQDIIDVEDATALFGGGVPRYAAIVAKHARHVMDRSGAKQVTFVGVSFGALVSRYIIEKDIEGLASSNSIARWVAAEGVVSGNYLTSHFPQSVMELVLGQSLDHAMIDLNHMSYNWITANLNNPNYTSSSPYFANFPIHFWVGADYDLYDGILTEQAGKASDGMVLMEDAILRNLPAELLYDGQLPTHSVLNANHDLFKFEPGFHVGLLAQLTGRTRATITLSEVEILREFDGGARGDGEYVFGLQVFSPLAETNFSVTDPIHELSAANYSLPYAELAVGTKYPLNLVWYDDIILPGEDQLKIITNIEEIDGDPIYRITEANGIVRQALENVQTFIDVSRNGSYPIVTGDWRGTVNVEINRYPPFGGPKAAATDWALFE